MAKVVGRAGPQSQQKISDDRNTTLRALLEARRTAIADAAAAAASRAQAEAALEAAYAASWTPEQLAAVNVPELPSPSAKADGRRRSARGSRGPRTPRPAEPATEQS